MNFLSLSFKKTSKDFLSSNKKFKLKVNLKKMSDNIPQEKLYDLQIIHQMCRGNHDQVEKMVAVFIIEVSKTIGDIESALSEKDFSRIKNLAHKVKPTLNYFGTVSLEKEVIEVESLLSKDFNINELQSKIATISDISKKVVDQLKSHFNL
ncbi:MAG: hypothetical protein COZ16_13020 [Flavobacteriaceae bacterium CG_4_10_14_3_um_filter_31_253]|nr:MAG: hypothetical protein AUK46_01210 [Flavobacteriaceae bacterium CG2_30_31_66]PIV97106.1 MAG: hypothetical protein COW43_05000 [Flavobacteriaceae bacterium CG17_big_fil_post_rev_8_21_14_2_50_31_13]PIX11340.1 MAG: hypothetical protein COZ74_14330 [Flavobacteriaceae bacterium CG_4_8_14_3_um_filter_31_8]PIY13731.1 MAG: hypothetical protein COZ16_13020 [Flavobacteriaceae bacterium CG_4_10_14_3_um_filter_31_253]PIZ10775.1 MAG: hypothetical protein COY55_06675 [Flavobacteriaceae bacterium CG_4_1